MLKLKLQLEILHTGCHKIRLFDEIDNNMIVIAFKLLFNRTEGEDRPS